MASRMLLEYESRRRTTGIDTKDLKQDPWLTDPDLPTSTELAFGDIGVGTADAPPELPVNHVNGPWDSKAEYLRSHYRLLREDAINSLRAAIAEVRDKPDMAESADIRIYDKVHIVGFTFAHQGLATRVAFSTIRAGKRILWEQSKRLISSSVVVLTPKSDMFQTVCKVAVIAARPLDGLSQTPPEVDLFFSGPEDLEIDPQQEWVMVETSNAYFESYRHTLTGLQRLMHEKFPLSEHLINLQRHVQPPAHVRENPYTDLSSVFPTTQDGDSFENVDVLGDFPDTPTDKLDRSQLNALKTILTKKLAIIQGPPGTGKTHVSVVALTCLLSRTTDEDPPLIIASHTNHALDQLLRYVAEIEPNFIRLGGRTTDQGIIKDRTLYEVKKTLKNLPHSNGGYQRIKICEDQLCTLLKPLYAKDGHVTAETLCEYGLITQAQFQSLERGASAWISTVQQDQSTGLISKWLGDELVRTDDRWKVGEELVFEYEEVDLEFEQLKELEAETPGANDDEKPDALSGKWQSIFQSHTAQKYPGITRQRVEKALKTDDLWDIEEADLRSAVYHHLESQLKVRLRARFRELAKGYFREARNIKLSRYEKDAAALQTAKVIGMTTTGLVKFRALVDCLKPRVLLVEEAAEALEGTIAAGCVESLEHLILVGDHKQRRGSCAVHDLTGPPFNLDVSLFERMLMNGVSYAGLTRQRRMVPEIRRILAPIYDYLEDHPSVLEKEAVPGMGKISSFFYTHRWPESSDSLSSRINVKEASMIVGMFNYLVFNGMDAKDITVLTFYNGQRKEILKSLKRHSNLQGRFFNVKTVDSYQGEENGVVLLSLVRSNDRKNIGFLGDQNRVCVALSRAQRGFYVFGNALNLCLANRLWWKVVKIMSDGPRRVGYTFPLVCTNHGARTWVKEPHQWEALHGGCQRRCGGKLPCGHECGLNCHPFPHEKINCKEPCRNILSCGHACKEKCGSEDCHCLKNCGPTANRRGTASGEIPIRGGLPYNTVAWHQYAKAEVRAADAEEARKGALLARDCRYDEGNPLHAPNGTGALIEGLSSVGLALPACGSAKRVSREKTTCPLFTNLIQMDGGDEAVEVDVEDFPWTNQATLLD